MQNGNIILLNIHSPLIFEININSKIKGVAMKLYTYTICVIRCYREIFLISNGFAYLTFIIEIEAKGGESGEETRETKKNSEYAQ